MKFPHLLALSGAVGLTLSTQAVPIAGQIRDASSNDIAAARVTLFTSDLRFFQEKRTDVTGVFQLQRHQSFTGSAGQRWHHSQLHQSG